MKFLDQLMHTTKSNRRDSQLPEPIYRTPDIMLSPMSDRVGLQKAYDAVNKVFVHGETMRTSSAPAFLVPPRRFLGASWDLPGTS